MNVPSAEVGIDSSTLKVERHEPRNMPQQTSAVMTIDSSTVHSVSRMAWSVKTVPSKLTAMCRSGAVTASSLLICVTNARTALPTATSFSPCCFWMPTPSVISPLLRALLRIGQAVLDRGHIAQVNVGMVNPLAAARRNEQVAHLFRRMIASPMVRTFSWSWGFSR